jgi:putative flippase GtrA
MTLDTTTTFPSPPQACAGGPTPGRRDPVEAGPSMWRRLVRYGSVSAIATTTSLLILGILVLLGWPAVLANVVATAVGTVPSFELNRRWVWAQDGRRSLIGQVLPFCLLSFAGLVLSTVAVHIAADATVGSTRLVRTAAVESANVGTYGVLWLVQFFLCDRVLFARRAAA